MAEFSFEVRQDALDLVRRADIQANFDECKAALTEMMQPYKTLIVSEDTLPQAKADRARIRKVAARIDEARKEVKRIYTEPLAIFEGKCKELIAICSEADQNIDKQVKEFDQKRKDAKVEELRAYFFEHVGDVADYLSFPQIFNPRWENATYAIETAKADIMREITSCVSAVNAIRTLHSPFETTLLDLYRQHHDLAECMNKHEQLTALREMEEKRKAQMEAQQAVVAAQRAAQPPMPTNDPEPAPQIDVREEETPSVEPEVAEPIYVVDFRVYVTKAQGMALKAFFKENGIKFGRVPNNG